MPKERRKRLGAHDPSARLSSRQFALAEKVEHVEIGSSLEASGNDILRNMAQGHSELRDVFKKEKQQLKREALLRRLESSRSPYSKSHNRRLKRKAKEQIAGGLGDMQAAISALENAVEVEPSAEQVVGKPRSEQKPGQIGEGKGAPLSKGQRKRALQLERLRHPMILSNPEFSSNPFQTIRTHAQNTLLKHKPPS